MPTWPSKNNKIVQKEKNLWISNYTPDKTSIPLKENQQQVYSKKHNSKNKIFEPVFKEIQKLENKNFDFLKSGETSVNSYAFIFYEEEGYANDLHIIFNKPNVHVKTLPDAFDEVTEFPIDIPDSENNEFETYQGTAIEFTGGLVDPTIPQFATFFRKTKKSSSDFKIIRWWWTNNGDTVSEFYTEEDASEFFNPENE